MLTQGNELSEGARRSIMDSAGFSLSMVVEPHLEKLHTAILNGDITEAQKLLKMDLKYRPQFPS
jgi:hypothetical protein